MVVVHVEIWSDIACPWCYVGKRRFERALADYEHRDEITLTWRSFELDPHAPAEREQNGAEHLAAKYGTTLEQAQAMNANLEQVAAGEGVEIDFERQRGGNTFDAHRLVHLAAARGLQDAMQGRLMRAYFGEGELMSDHAALARLAAEVGLPAWEVAETLAGDRFAAEVREDERTASRIGISAVPFFVADRAVGVAGAQPPEILVEFLRRAAERQAG